VNLNQDTPAVRPTWEIVEKVLAALSATQARFSGVNGRTYQLERYDPNWRVLAVAEDSSRWVHVQDIRGCWDTLERLGRIEREDVLDPGRCSSFMMALFEQVPGVERDSGREASLVFARALPATSLSARIAAGRFCGDRMRRANGQQSPTPVASRRYVSTATGSDTEQTKLAS
jgi:hypothetical protein